MEPLAGLEMADFMFRNGDVREALDLFVRVSAEMQEKYLPT